MKRTQIKSRFWLSAILAVGLAAGPTAGPVAPANASEAFGQSQGAEPVTRDERQLDALDGEILSLTERVPVLKQRIAEMKRLQSETAANVADAERNERELKSRLEQAAAAYRGSIDTLKEAVQIDYEAEDRGVIELAVETGSISETMSRESYRAAIGARLEQYAKDAENAESELRQRQDRLTGVISSLEVLQRQQRELAEGLEQQQRELAEAIGNREDEAEYLRKRIARAKAVRAGLLAGVLGGEFEDGERVRRGSVIGFEGSTGFSTGCHTHFSVIDGGRWADPALYWRELRKPEGDLTQPFGMTSWAKGGAYGGNIHNGIDFVQGCGSPVRAAADGTIIRDIRGDGSGFGHYVMIRHEGGIVTLYGHLI